MATRGVQRQHEETTIPELSGRACSRFEVVRNSKCLFGPLYIQLDGVWHRLYLDEGLLFWREGWGPNTDDDLLEDEHYFDLAEALGVREVAVSNITMRDCRLELRFANGARLVLKHDVGGEATVMVELVPGV